MNIVATEARKDFFHLLKNSIEKHEVQHIHHAKGDVVMLSAVDYESMRESLELLSIPDFREKLIQSSNEIKAGETLSMDEVFNDV